MFGETSGIHRWIWRGGVLLLSMVFLGNNLPELFCMGVALYVLLALIFPIQDKDYHHCSMLKYRLTQIRDLRL